MLKNVSRLLLLAALPAGLCRAQDQPAVETEQPPAVRPAADLTIPELLTAARQRRAAGIYNEAISLFNLVLQRDQTNVDALRSLGEMFVELRNADQAQKHWLRVLDIQANDFVANFGLGRLHLASGIARNAMRYLETALSVVPADPPELEPQVLIALAQAYRGSGYRDKAVETIEKALKLNPHSFEAQYVLVTLRTEVATRDRREAAFDQALADAESLVRIAENDLRANGTSPARLQTLDAAYQTKLQVLHAFRRILFERNPDGSFSDRILSGREALAAMTISRTVEVMLAQADLRRSMSHFTILELAATAVKYDGGTNPRTLLTLGSLLVATGQWDGAIQTFQKVLELDPGNEAARRQLEGLQSRRPTPATAPSTAPTP